jgi:Uma2 family endonuclease
MRLVDALLQLLVHPGHGQLFAAPVGVEFPDTAEGVQPDIVFVSTAQLHMVKEDTIQGAPDLVIEVLSPSTARRDRTVKLDLYRRQGVGEYWIVDGDAKQIEAWRFAAGATDAELHTDRVPVRLRDRALGEIELATIFDRAG